MRKKEECSEYVTFWNIGLVWLLHGEVLVGCVCSADVDAHPAAEHTLSGCVSTSAEHTLIGCAC